MTAPTRPRLTARERARVNAEMARQETVRATAAVTAAATPQHPDAKGKFKLRQRESWQDDVYAYFDTVPELKYATLYVQNAFSKLRVVPAVTVNPDEIPLPIDAEDSPLSETEQEQVRVEFSRLRSDRGGQARITARLGAQLFLVGECHLVGKPATNPEADAAGVTAATRPEQWDVLSINELEEKNGQLWEVDGKPGGNLQLTGDKGIGALVVRIHQEHLSKRDRPDSSVNGVLDAMEELAILCRVVRATGKSRIAQSSIVGVPHELSPPPRGDDGEVNGPSPLAKQLMEHFITPIGDEGSASAAAPFLIEGPAEYLKAMKDSVIELTRPLDPVMTEQRKELRVTIATGIDLPPEVLTGVADVNHWTAWQVSEETFKAHLEPRAITMVEALTIGWLRVALMVPASQGGPGWSQDRADLVQVWYDASRLVAKPNREAAADTAHDRMVISDEAYRDAKGFTDDDAPDPEEIVRRIAAKRTQFDGSLSEPFLRLLLEDLVVRRVVPAGQAIATSSEDGVILAEPAVDGDAATQSPPAGGGEDGTPPAGSDSDGTPSSTPPSQQAVTAGAARRPRGEALSRRMVDIDRDLRARLEQECDLAMRAALTRAGNRLANAAQKRGQEARQVVAATDRPLLAAALGRPVVAALGVTDDELLAEAFADLGVRFDELTAAAQAQVLDELAAVLGLDEAAVAAFGERQAVSRALGVEVLTAGMLGLAKQRLYDPNPTAPADGEALDATVPVALVRTAVSAAGGASAHPTADVQTAHVEVRGGVGIGGDVIDLMSGHGAKAEQYEWVYGISRNRFRPHAALTGVRFGRFDDPALTNSQSWPPVAFYSPGDHDGCRCDAYPVWMLREDEQFHPHSGPAGISAPKTAA